MIRVGIIGDTGYVLGELISLLIHHPDVSLAFVCSEQRSNERIAQVYASLRGEIDLRFCNQYDLSKVDMVFLCGSEALSTRFWASANLPAELKVVDMASALLRETGETQDFVYGLPELNRKRIIRCERVINPSCVATVVQLALLPLLKFQKFPTADIHIHTVLGSTYGVHNEHDAMPFNWLQNNVSLFDLNQTTDYQEVKQTLATLAPDYAAELHLTTLRGSFPRGVFMSLYTMCTLSIEELLSLYEEAFSDHSFVFVTTDAIDMKQVINTNKAFISLSKQGDQLQIVCCIDNLLKGAAGQAVHNMNLLFGLTEQVGLMLKSPTY